MRAPVPRPPGLLGAQQRHHSCRHGKRAARGLGLGDLANDHPGPGLGHGVLDGERRRLEVERIKRDAEQLRPAQPGGEQQRQHAISLGVPLGGYEKTSDLLSGERAGLFVRHAWRRGVGCRIMWNQPPLTRLPERGVEETVNVQHALS